MQPAVIICSRNEGREPSHKTTTDSTRTQRTQQSSQPPPSKKKRGRRKTRRGKTTPFFLFFFFFNVCIHCATASRTTQAHITVHEAIDTIDTESNSHAISYARVHKMTIIELIAQEETRENKCKRRSPPPPGEVSSRQNKNENTEKKKDKENK